MEKSGNSITINVGIPLLQTNVTDQNIHILNHNHHDHDRDHDEQQADEVNSKLLKINGVGGEEDETLLDKKLQRLDFHLSFLGFYQWSQLSIVVSWIGFLIAGVAVPVLVLMFTRCSDCEGYKVQDFEYEILTSQILLASVSLISVSHNIRKKGIRKFLFVDKYTGHTSKFMEQYINKIKVSYRLLFLTLLPCCLLKLGHELIRTVYIQNQPWWKAAIIVLVSTISWTYLSAISLVGCVLFNLSCNLQLIHFHDYKSFFERAADDTKEPLEKEPDMSFLMTEHVRLRQNLSKISHRFRIYLLLVFLLVTASLFATLVQITSSLGRVTFLNGGNFAVTSIVQVFETLLCLHAGTKISSKAQSIGAVATSCHALETCKYSEGNRRSDSIHRSISVASLPSLCSEGDLESLDSVLKPTRILASISSYNQRQSFVTYLQANPGGITLYGWTVDRNLLTTIFLIELSLILFVLGQTMVFSEETSQ